VIENGQDSGRLGTVNRLKAENGFFAAAGLYSEVKLGAVDFFCHLFSPLTAITASLTGEMTPQTVALCSAAASDQRPSNG
jgi:hypothetical protein